VILVKDLVSDLLKGKNGSCQFGRLPINISLNRKGILAAILFLTCVGINAIGKPLPINKAAAMRLVDTGSTISKAPGHWRFYFICLNHRNSL